MKRLRDSTSGYTLVEVVIAMGLFALISSAVAVAQLNSINTGLDIITRTSRDQIAGQLRMYAMDKRAILKSIKKPGNEAFYNCVCGVGTCTNMQSPYLPFTLYDTSDSLQSPMYYDINASPCDPATSQCPLRVSTTFFAQCKPDLASGSQNPALTCNGTPAEFIAIMYTVEENPDFTNKAKLRLRPLSGPVYLQTADLFTEVCL